MSYSVGKAIRELNNKNDNIYYLSGDDYFLQKFFITSLEKTYSNEYKTRYFNFEEEMDVKIFFEEIVSNSLFSSKDIFIIRNITRISINNKDNILEYINNPKEDLIIILVSDDYYTKNKFSQSLASRVKLIDTRTPFPNKVREWINYYVKTKKIDIDYSLLDDIISFNNDEISTIINEIEKIYLANNCDKISYDNIDNTSKSDKNIRPWHFLDSLGDKNIQKSTSIIAALQKNGYSIIPIMINLYNFYMCMLFYKNNLGNTFSYGLNKIINNNMIQYSKKYSVNEISNIIIDLKNMDILIKTTNLNHMSLISIFIIKICQEYYG